MPFRRLLLLSLLPLLAACGKTVIQINHTLQPHAPSSKPTAECKAPEMEVYSLLHNEAGFVDTGVVALNTGGCAVTLTLASPANAVKILTPVQGTSKSYSYYLSGTTKNFVNVWVDEAPMKFQDAKGKDIDTSPSDADCAAAVAGLKGTFDTTVATFTVSTDRKGASTPALRCYVDAVFAGANHAANFEHFMSWNNPGGKHEPFHYYVMTGSTPKVVYIHAVDQLQK